MWYEDTAVRQEETGIGEKRDYIRKDAAVNLKRVSPVWEKETAVREEDASVRR